MTHPMTAEYRPGLPQLSERRFLTDGGLETTLIFHGGWELPLFEAFTLMESDRGRHALRAYFERYISLAAELGYGFILESPTWRANPDWGAKAGYSRDRLAKINQSALALMGAIREEHVTPTLPIVISGNVGPRGDGYDASQIMSVAEAESYHSWQIRILRDAGADFVSAFTMTNANEATGFVRAARAAGIQCVISFTLETDGRLPSGETLAAAIDAVDDATGGAPAYYMINCAHPTHFVDTLGQGARWTQRLRGIRANASCRSHAELDNSPDLDAGDPEEMGRQYQTMLVRFPHITVLGGCCGTDHRHVECIGKACHQLAA